ncbi:MAG: hypothetical protein HY812_16590 [Planctomycetes bacterium]|nr:hypothetical protein [Planctomycetota bacterium]
MPRWFARLRHDPVAPLLASGDAAVVYHARRDLLLERVPEASCLWDLPAAAKILRKQGPSGCWISRSPSRLKAPATNYDLFETFKQLAQLTTRFGFDRRHEAIRAAAEYVFSCQTAEGDIRGILGDQYAPYYTGLILSHLIAAGYADDARVAKGLHWLLSMRQDDGGWVIGSPGVFGRYSAEERRRLTSHRVGTKTDFDRARPFTHSGTGMVIRAFALHPRWRHRKEALAAALLLKSRFFKRDSSTSYRDPDNWVRFKYPFFWTDLVSALDSVSLIGIPREDADVRTALRWLIERQLDSGLWRHSYSTIHKAGENAVAQETRLWVTLAICRIFMRCFGD